VRPPTALGPAWVARRGQADRSLIALLYIAFPARVPCIRNDGVRCSSHLSGTTFLEDVQQGKSERSTKGPSAWVALVGLPWVLWAGSKTEMGRFRTGSLQFRLNI